MPEYRFASGGVPVFKQHKDADAKVIGEALAKISAAQRGRLKAEHVVDAARPTAHPLHRFFEWRDKVAAEAFRREQARSLIRAIEIVREDDEEGTAPAFVSITADDGRSYRSMEEVLTNVSLQLAVLKAAERDLRNFEKRYRELLDICDLVRSARERLGKRIAGTQDESRPSA